MSRNAKKSSNDELQGKQGKVETKIGEPRKVALIVALCIIIGYAVFLRAWHLLDTNYYYIIGPNSFLYNRMAELIISGAPPLPIPEVASITSTGGSGLAYPLAYTAYILAFIFHTSTTSGLVLAGEILPLVLTVVTLLIMYFVVSKTNNRLVGVSSVLAMAIMPLVYLVQASGYLDRDALSLLLVMVGVFAYYFLRKWHFKRENRDYGWIISAIPILSIEYLLFSEWNFGAFIMIAIISGSFTSEFIGDFLKDFLKGYDKKVLPYLLRSPEFVVAGLEKVPNQRERQLSK